MNIDYFQLEVLEIKIDKIFCKFSNKNKDQLNKKKILVKNNQKFKNKLLLKDNIPQENQTKLLYQNSLNF